MNIEEFFDSQNWIFAKTYAKKAPHEYIVRHKINGKDEDFVNAVKCIYENGFVDFFWGKSYTYLKVGDMVYWTMGYPAEETILINRCNYNDRFGGKDVLQGK